MLTEYEQAKEDNDRPKIVWLPSLLLLPGSDHCYSLYVTPWRLWKWLPKRQTGMGDFSLGMPDSSDTYLTMPYMVSNSLPPVRIELIVRLSVKKIL